MKRYISTILNDQSGYLWFFITIAVIFVVLVAAPQQLYTESEIPYSDECYIKNPNPIYDVTFNEQKYTLIRARSGTITEEIKAHFSNVGNVNNYRGEPRQAYTAWIDGFKQEAKRGIYGPITGVEDLFFIHSDADTVISAYPGHTFLDIYLKEGRPVPPFIVSFCSSITRVNPYKLFVNQDKETTPPLFINTDDLYDFQPSTERDCGEECAPPPNTKYALVSYEEFRGRINLREDGWWPSAKIKVKVGNTESEFLTNFAFLTPIKLIALFMPDPEDPNKILQFNYIPETMAVPSRIVQPDLNINYQNENWDQSSLMLRAFLPLQIPNWGWWTPECKPAIYLYPKNKMKVNVKVQPKGFLTYTDPIYNSKTGWNVLAYPSGKLEWLDNSYGIDSQGRKRITNMYDYLYYESKIHDSMISKPATGFVVTYAELENFYRTYLPQAGLNTKETNDYIDYWLKVLPKADAYFINFLTEKNITEIEPLNITPNPDSLLRVRLYYEMLSLDQIEEKKINSSLPNINAVFNRDGFTVVEWGGMVKQDKDHPFTCSM